MRYFGNSKSISISWCRHGQYGPSLVWDFATTFRLLLPTEYSSPIITASSFNIVHFQIDKLGTRFCLILGGMFIITLPSSLFYPIPAVFLTFQVTYGTNGVTSRHTDWYVKTRTFSFRYKVP